MLRLVAFGLVVLFATGVQAVGPGDAAPDFSLQDVSGSTYTLSAFQGKVVLLALVGYG